MSLLEIKSVDELIRDLVHILAILEGNQLQHTKWYISKPFQDHDLAWTNVQPQHHTWELWSIPIFPPRTNHKCEPRQNNPKLHSTQHQNTGKPRGAKHRSPIVKKKYQPIGLESSLKFESCRMRPRCVKLRSSSRNVGSPSRRSLWTTKSAFNATYMAQTKMQMKLTSSMNQASVTATRKHSWNNTNGYPQDSNTISQVSIDNLQSSCGSWRSGGQGSGCSTRHLPVAWWWRLLRQSLQHRHTQITPHRNRNRTLRKKAHPLDASVSHLRGTI
jgi:hypothetical protein